MCMCVHLKQTQFIFSFGKVDRSTDNQYHWRVWRLRVESAYVNWRQHTHKSVHITLLGIICSVVIIFIFNDKCFKVKQIIMQYDEHNAF